MQERQHRYNMLLSRYMWDPKHCPINAGGTRRCRAGKGSTGFNVLNQMFYGQCPTIFAAHCMSDIAQRDYSGM